MGQSAQEEHDEMMCSMDFSEENLIPSSEFKALIKKRKGNSSQPAPSIAVDPIAAAMARHPNLTREAAEEMLEDLGY